MTPTPHDILIIGYGPVGQTLAILLAQRGHRVAVIERWAQIYPRPRAVVFDDEVARVLAGAGLADRFAEFSEPNLDYEWRNAAGDTLLRFPLTPVGGSGWPESNMFTQPVLEAALNDRAGEFDHLRVDRGTEAVGLVQHDDQVEVVTRDGRTLRASYVVGCDGANSFVRGCMATTTTDLGFFYNWLICDVITREPRTWTPANLQVCDPERPTTAVSGGPGRRRWEFMRMPGDVPEEFDTDETAWRLLAKWDITPQNATLEKRAVYTFQARWADSWRDGRLLLAGDAAHLMPPFAGQGMCSGIRDAANLAWKLDLVLRGVASDELLTAYSTERSAHVRHAIHFSAELGKVICQTDPRAVVERDAALIATGPDPRVALPPVPPPRLGPGALQSGPDGEPLRPAGQIAVQGRVRGADGRTGLLDDVAGSGFHILVDGERVTADRPTPSPEQAALLKALDARIVRILPTGTRPAAASETPAAETPAGGGPAMTVEDTDGVLLPHLRSSGHLLQIVRPDCYIFGGTPNETGFPGLLAELEQALTGQRAAASADHDV